MNPNIHIRVASTLFSHILKIRQIKGIDNRDSLLCLILRLFSVVAAARKYKE